MLLPSESVEGDANVEVEVKMKNRFKIDLVDYIPLAERRRLAVSGCPLMWTANLPAASLAIPRLLKEIFLADFGLTVKSVNPLSPNKHTLNCDYARDSKISRQYPYSAMLQDGRVVEVMINTSKYSNSVQENSADFDEDKGSPKDSSIQSANLNLHTTSVPNFAIKVNSEQCSNVIRMKTDMSESVRDELDSISLQKSSILLLPCLQFDQSKLPQTSRQILPTETINCTSSLVDNSHFPNDENDMEANLTPSYAQKARQIIGHGQVFPVSDRQEYNFDGETEKCNMSLSTSGSYSFHENEIHNSTSKICQSVASAIPHHRKRIKLEPLQENDNDQNSKVVFEENTWCDPDLVTNSSPLAFHVPVQKKLVDANYSNSFPQMVITSPKLLSEIAVHCGKCISTQRHCVCHPEKNPSIAEKNTSIEETNQATFDTNGQESESSSTAFSFKVKPEPFVEKIDDVASESVGKHSNGCSSYVLALKAVKMKVHEDILVDEMDLIPLRKRREMLLCKRAFDFKTSKQSQTFLNTENHYVKVKQRKHKKSATDSAETALKEDAPGLLQVLIDSGVDFKDVKLYETLNDDNSLCALDEDSSEDCFDEFGNIMAKLFSKCHGMLFKMGSFKDDKGSKAYYSLSCLVSLIEQIRHMQLIKYPVQWGWCRDIQSFIFVFEKHNRIVVERPEYGYATYFFELVETFPVDWQVKRLVITMKLTKYSRVTLIEDKPLIIGEDLNEGEARVLEDYGWTPNSGLGSLLNFVDRVVHDKKSEMNSSEWRSKIGKLLMKGYHGGQLVIPNLPKKVSDHMNNSPIVKLEL